MNPPIIRIELEHMKNSILRAFSQQTLLMDEMVKETVEKICTEENVRSLFEEKAREFLKQAIETEAHDYFTYGEGAIAVKEALKESIQKQFKRKTKK